MKIHNEGTEWASTEYEFSDLIGKTLKTVNNFDDERIVFTTVDGEVFTLCHRQDCCESVRVESIVGDLTDLIGTPILVAEERTSRDDPADIVRTEDELRYRESQTWTFYTIRTINGSVDIRWFGESNGYYSESVEFFHG